MSKDREDFDSNEWGNIGPDSIHDPAWNQRRPEHLRLRQHEIMLERYKNEAYKEKWDNANQERWKDPEWREQHLAKMQEGRTEESETNRLNKTLNNKTWKEKYGVQNRWQDPEFRKKIIKANSGPKTKEMLIKKLKSQGMLPFKCPWGVYISPAEASRESLEKYGEFKTAKHTRIRLKREVSSGFDGYDYISWEEYERIMK